MNWLLNQIETSPNVKDSVIIIAL